MRLKRWLLFVAVSWSVSCGGLPSVPSQGGPRWRAIESEHFVLYTDQPEAAARRSCGKLERVLAALLQLGFRTQGQLAFKLPVILLDDRSHFETFVGVEYGGMYRQELLFEPRLVLTRETDSESWSTLAHELTHFIADQALGPQPPWLAEGLAAYFESAHFDSTGTFIIGSAPRRYQRWLRDNPHLGAQDLMTLTSGYDTTAVYASAWLVVHYLMSERSVEFAAFQAALASGKPAQQSWRESLPELSPERLDAFIDGYAAAGSYMTFSRKLPEPEVQLSVRELSDADVYALRAELFTLCRQCGKEAAHKVTENLQAALQSDPNHLRARAMQALLSTTSGAPAVARDRALVQKHPNAWLAWLLLARSQSAEGSAADGCDADVVPKLQALAPRQPYALMSAALCELKAGHRESALAISSQALALQPANGVLLLLRATVLRTLGACDELKRVVERVRNATHTPVTVGEHELQQLSQCSQQ